MRKIGIWIDIKEANLITLTEEDISSKTIYSDVETRVREDGEKKQFGRFGDQFMVDEKGKENRVNEHTHKYLLRVLKELSEADEVMLFGPAQTKIKLQKLISESPVMAAKLKETRAAQNMTHNQKLAYVKDFFSKN